MDGFQSNMVTATVQQMQSVLGHTAIDTVRAFDQLLHHLKASCKELQRSASGPKEGVRSASGPKLYSKVSQG